MMNEVNYVRQKFIRSCHRYRNLSFDFMVWYATV